MITPPIDSSVVRWSVPRNEVASALADRPLLIMMHGYGSNEGDLFSLAQFLPPEFVVASLRGQNASGPGFTWFHITPDPITGMLNRDINEVNSSTESLLAWIDDLEAEVGELPSIAVLGFSQGGVMALQLLRHAPERFNAGIVLAGFAVDDETPSGRERDARLAAVLPPVFWARDPHDPVIHPDLVAFTRQWLPEHSDLDARLYSNVGHSISVEEIEDVAEFLRLHAL
ncbi:dienelactone hydrolase family protein [Alpinimonas psychrophila]|uniref:Phospholipase/carboxylesterase n=1 Tax=Alpinimonas psychrophila TaxID=748908 RepID=A0A7W3JS91_9MICO|nr:alpha/beta fold hydrolase [Alpinimonas psychrophila]MBA8828251.1 phospholipase/carboxylesterase [Alpinimonas psychrophila]